MVDYIRGQLLTNNGDNGFLYRNFSLYRVDLDTGKEMHILDLPASPLHRFLAKFRLMNRLLRLDPRCVTSVDNDHLLLCLDSKVILINLKSRTVETIADSRPGFSNPLNFCKISGSFYWGDYGSNSNHEAINIYRWNLDGDVEIVYTFPSGDIRHVHNIIYDDIVDKFWVLTGDTEPKSGIYLADRDWINVYPIKVGKQCYRAVVGFPYKGGLLYATDTVEEENHLCLLTNSKENVKILSDMNGSCIYGTQTADYYIFSTTVESHEGDGWKKMLSKELGAGIKSCDVCVIQVNKKDSSFSTVIKFRKDRLPMKLFQYGRVRFAVNTEHRDNTLWGAPIACEKYDGKTIRIDIDE